MSRGPVGQRTPVPSAATANPFRAGLGWERVPPPCAVVIFGASGDLTRRKLVPALYALTAQGLLPDAFAVVGAGRSQLSDEQWRQDMAEAVATHGRLPWRDEVWSRFAPMLHYAAVDPTSPSGLAHLRQRLEECDRQRGTQGNRVYYLSVPPSAIATYADRLGGERLSRPRANGFVRLVVEKPFGRDLSSARELNARLHRSFAESQIYRIDHYLGKETVQNILVFRFANGIFEPIWNRQYVDHVQITVAESLGVEGRGAYYEESGALRDIVQNHMMQLLAIVGMEPPSNFQAETVRDEKVKVLRAIRPIHPDDVLRRTVRGQYGRGWIEARAVPGYREEPGVPATSLRETFVALRLDVDNWRWAQAPFYLRTGKRLPRRVTEVAIQFRAVPHSPFAVIAENLRATAAGTGDETSTGSVVAPVRSASTPIDPNLLVLRIQPDEGITLRVGAKVPGQSFRIRSVNMDFLYGSAFFAESPDAYERLLLDCLLGDTTLFAREDEVEEAWRICTAILDGWRAHPPDAGSFPNYEAGTWGPAEADELLARDGRAWRRL